MTTDSETLMREGIETGRLTFKNFLADSGWSLTEIDKSFCHQVGTTHRKIMLESLGISSDIDFMTVDWLGNTGSAALPTTLAIGLEQGFIQTGDKTALLGIGSGINSLMMGVEWQTVPQHEKIAKPHFQKRSSISDDNATTTSSEKTVI